jgi:hypothetical protein
MTVDWNTANDHEKVLLLVEDLVSNFLYYDRKEDEDMPVGKIEELVKNGDITVDKIVETFRDALVGGGLQPEPDVGPGGGPRHKIR